MNYSGYHQAQPGHKDEEELEQMRKGVKYRIHRGLVFDRCEGRLTVFLIENSYPKFRN
jgi:hypothetical protein